VPSLMPLRFQCFVLACALFALAAANDAPVIGILTQPYSGPNASKSSTYIAASYVKYIESAGGRVVPVHFTQSQKDLAALLSKLNGILFPGGGADLSQASQFIATASLAFNTSVAAALAGETFPVWGTCLGFQTVCTVASRNFSLLEEYDAENISLPLTWTADPSKSRMFGGLSAAGVSTLSNHAVTMNNHHFGVSPDAFASDARLSSLFNVLSTNNDRAGKPFVSSIEGKSIPVYATQWHPEKNQFEWNPTEGIDHSAQGVAVMSQMSQFFVNQARLSTRAFSSEQELESALIYQFSPTYTGGAGHSFEQTYIFDEALL